MKQWIYEQYGGPEVLTLQEVARPTPADDEVLVKVIAASVNPLDWHFMRGKPVFMRMEAGLRAPKEQRLGADVAGVVVDLGRDVDQFQIGDAVFGDIFPGGFGEFVAAKPDKLVHKPDNITFAEAAAVPVAGLTALQSLNSLAPVQAGQHVLVNGGAGGVGSFTVQIAKAAGAEVSAVVSTGKVELARTLGADHVIDYTQTNVARSGKQYDLIIDNVGNLSVGTARRLLKPNGAYVVVGLEKLLNMAGTLLLGGVISRFGDQTIGLMGMAEVKQSDLLTLKALLADGKVRSAIDRCYPFEALPEAVAYLEDGHASGKVIVTVADEPTQETT